MNRRKVIIGAIAAFAALTGLACEEDPRNPGSYGDDGGKEPTKDTPPEPWEADPKKEWPGIRVAALSAWVEPAYGYYRVTATAKDLTTGEVINIIDAPDELGMKMKPGKQFQHVLAYPEGHRVELNMHVKAEKPGSTKGYLAVRVPARRAGRKTETLNGLAAKSLYTVVE